ncbi:hypothetical protein CS022_20720 [Veronia nyctiphanis]|uniref:GrpB family protein n=1 Tax=Veronia nyctiphanis TaxID=1278244 RepID=A0A4Q0YLA1_9GAMM|nr:GrpB family protein [Veronia nyctiphanis]RXJ71540.1 hypothetical protein CS022_20720 [Veronia nyctiphanis]
MKFLESKDYQKKCWQHFERYSSEIKSLIPDARVEHIGASSIPEAISKGDLDIFVGVEPEDLEQAVISLKALGFEEKIDTLRTPKLCMLESTIGNDVALQVVANGSEFECFLAFRDSLRADASLVKQYNQLKRTCEGYSHDAYREKKSGFIENVLSLN